MSNERYFTVTHDPHQRLALGTRLTVSRLWQLLEDERNNGLEVVEDSGNKFRLYRLELYKLAADGQMRLWRMPGA